MVHQERSPVFSCGHDACWRCLRRRPSPPDFADDLCPMCEQRALGEPCEPWRAGFTLAGIRAALKRGACVEDEDGSVLPFLHHAAHADDVDLLRELVAGGADVCREDVGMRTPLHHAARSGNTSAANALLSLGVGVNVRASDGTSPLHMAAERGRLTMVSLLYHAGADVHAYSYSCGSPLHGAVRSGDVGTVEFILDCGADPNRSVYRFDSPLHLAAQMDLPAAARLLRARGACAHTTNGDGHTPLELALAHGHHRVARELTTTRPTAEQQIHRTREVNVGALRTERGGRGHPWLEVVLVQVLRAEEFRSLDVISLYATSKAVAALTHAHLRRYLHDARIAVPRGVEHLVYGLLSGHQVNLAHLSKLRSFDFAPNAYHFCIGTMPPSLEHLRVMASTTFVSDGPRLPQLTSLVFHGPMYVTECTARLPVSLTKLHCGSRFGRDPDLSALTNLTELTLGFGFNCPLNAGAFPPSLRVLAFGNRFDREISPGVLPPNLEHLTFGRHFAKPIRDDVLPRTLTTLRFGHCFEGPIDRRALPPALTELRFGCAFDGELALDRLTSLRTLRLNAEFCSDATGLCHALSRSVDTLIVAVVVRDRADFCLRNDTSAFAGRLVFEDNMYCREVDSESDDDDDRYDALTGMGARSYDSSDSDDSWS